MHGVSGSGKSRVAQSCAKKSSAIILKADAIRKHITNTPLTISDADIYDIATSDMVYLFLTDTSVHLTDVGFNVVLDATFLDVMKRQEVLSVLKQAQLDVRILSVECSEETAKKRIESRTGDVSDATNKILKLQMDGYVPLTEKERKITDVINND